MPCAYARHVLNQWVAFGLLPAFLLVCALEPGDTSQSAPPTHDQPDTALETSNLSSTGAAVTPQSPPSPKSKNCL